MNRRAGALTRGTCGEDTGPTKSKRGGGSGSTGLLARSHRARRPVWLLLMCVLACSSVFRSSAAATTPLLITNGFAHNDYEHTRPLLDALELGFCAVEA